MKKNSRFFRMLPLALCLLFSGCQGAESRNQVAPTPETGKTVEQMIAEKNSSGSIVTIDGVDYRKKRDVQAYLVMGIDKPGTVTENTVIGGQCDFLQLIVVDGAAQSYTRLEINRETMAEVDILDAEGDPLGITTKQMICFAHTYGPGDEKSCENAEKAVSRLLGDIEIDGYVALQYDAVPVINDTLGGVTVLIEDDFSGIDDTLVQGQQVKLLGQHALTFIRSRMSMADDSNVARMRRQGTYLNAFSQSLRESMKADSDVLNRLYQSVSDYMVTDLSSGEISSLVLKTAEYTSTGMVTPAGETREVTYKSGNVHNVFFPDEDSINQLILDLFYKPV